MFKALAMLLINQKSYLLRESDCVKVVYDLELLYVGFEAFLIGAKLALCNKEYLMTLFAAFTKKNIDKIASSHTNVWLS